MGGPYPPHFGGVYDADLKADKKAKKDGKKQKKNKDPRPGCEHLHSCEFCLVQIVSTD